MPLTVVVTTGKYDVPLVSFDVGRTTVMAVGLVTDGCAAVLPRIYAEASYSRHGLLTDLAMARVIAVVAAVLTSHLFFAVVLQLSE